MGMPSGSHQLLANLIVLGAGIEALQHKACLGWHNSSFIVFPGKGCNRLNRIEPHNGDEFDFILDPPAEKLDLVEARNVPVPDADEDLFAKEVFVDIRVLRGGV